MLEVMTRRHYWIRPLENLRALPRDETRVFTVAVCPVPHETETVVSKGVPA